jgi:RNA polymerase sigma-70 factor (ECF subfamily)
VSTSYRYIQPAGGGATAPPLVVPLDSLILSEDADVAFEQLYRASFPKVYAFIRCQVSTVETAQELVGRVFLKAYRHRIKIPHAGPAHMQWIFRIAHTTLIDYWRVEKRRESFSLPLEEIAELPTGSENPEAAYERKQRGVHIIRLMSGLSQDDRTMLALKFCGERTNREIAGILSLSEGAVSMRLLRALRRLRDQLKDLGWP